MTAGFPNPSPPLGAAPIPPSTYEPEGDVVTTAQVTGIDLIAAERQRQVLEKGWTVEHDLDQGPETLLDAARAYLICVWNDSLDEPLCWPWSAEFWRPYDPPRDLLTKAGALAQAALDIGGGAVAERLRDLAVAQIDCLLPQRRASDPAPGGVVQDDCGGTTGPCPYVSIRDD